jgi:hypothetical protein
MGRSLSISPSHPGVRQDGLLLPWACSTRRPDDYFRPPGIASMLLDRFLFPWHPLLHPPAPACPDTPLSHSLEFYFTHPAPRLPRQPLIPWDRLLFPCVTALPGRRYSANIALPFLGGIRSVILFACGAGNRLHSFMASWTLRRTSGHLSALPCPPVPDILSQVSRVLG